MGFSPEEGDKPDWCPLKTVEELVALSKEELVDDVLDLLNEAESKDVFTDDEILGKLTELIKEVIG